MKIMEDTQTPPVAKQRYIKTLEDYKSRLSSDPYLRLIDFCKEQHTDYRQLIYWMSHHQLSVRRLQAEARSEILEKESETFIQFVSAPKPISSCPLTGVSITFPDGVNLTLQESSVESVISLLTVYRSRLGGASSCSD